MNQRRGFSLFLLFLAVVALSGCATIPTGPSVTVFPGPGKSFDAFQADDLTCKQWANQQIKMSPNNAANLYLAAGAVLGTIIGAGLGAATGGAYGNPGAGAAIGAASGFVGGTVMASGPAYAAGSETQRRYDVAYQQCMYGKGNQTPDVVRPYRGSAPPPPPPPSWQPVPPPPDAYPPVPPDYR